MASYTIADKNVPTTTLRELYRNTKRRYRGGDWTELDSIFEVVVSNPDRFPGFKMQGLQSPETYIERWVKSYIDAKENLPSCRIASPKSACTDPAIKVIVQATQGLTDEQSANGEKIHNLFMSAENIQGNLLEEYIASKVRRYGFLWCAGNIVRAVDFCNTDGSLLLQIKNKSNTENSSSSSIREGTSIEKWYRLGTRTRNGEKIPDYKWADLNSLINQHKTQGHGLPPCNMSEPDYCRFLVAKAQANTRLITSR